MLFRNISLSYMTICQPHQYSTLSIGTPRSVLMLNGTLDVQVHEFSTSSSERNTTSTVQKQTLQGTAEDDRLLIVENSAFSREISTTGDRGNVLKVITSLRLQ